MSVSAFVVNHNIDPVILIVKSENSALSMLPHNLRRYGFIVYSSGLDGVNEVMKSRRRIDMVIIDCSGTDGNDSERISSAYDTCKSLSQGADISVIALSKRSENTNNYNTNIRYINPEMPGADIISSVRNVYKEMRPSSDYETMRCGDIVLSLMSYKVKRGNRNIHMGPTEFKILRCLMEDPKKVYSRKEIILYVWGEKTVEERTIDVHMNRLRSALRYNKNEPAVVETIRGVGYRLRESYS